MNLFEQRLSQRRDELKWLYLELYHDEAAFHYFVQMLRRCWDERKPSLRTQDKKREADPGWYRRRDILGMMLYVDAFAGNLSGVRDKLDYIQECGVNYLHLMPLLNTPKGRNGRLPARGDQPVPGLCDEPHQRGPRLGEKGPGRGTGLPGAVFLLRQLGHSPGV